MLTFISYILFTSLFAGIALGFFFGLQATKLI